MIEISTENVKRITVWLKPELLSRMDGWLETANCKNRSEFISKALRFYMGYLATDDISSYVCASVSQNIRGMLTENANRISKLMFKWSVDTPAGERAAFGVVFAAFSSGCARSKMAL